MVDPTGKFPLPVVTAAVGLGFGLVSNLGMQLYSNGFDIHSVNWKNVGIAGATGTAAGLLAPTTAVTAAGAAGAALLGAAANTVQYSLTQLANSQQISFEGITMNAATGAAGGLIGGAVKIPLPEFNPSSPWLDPNVARALNDRAAVLANVGLSNLIRNVGGSIVSNFNFSTLAGDRGGGGCSRR